MYSTLKSKESQHAVHVGDDDLLAKSSLDSLVSVVKRKWPSCRDIFGQVHDRIFDVTVVSKVTGRTQNDLCPACSKFLDAFVPRTGQSKSSPEDGFEFVVTLDHILLHRDPCKFCKLLFGALCLEENDPFKAPAVAGHLPGPLTGMTFGDWGWSQKQRLWPFGHSDQTTTRPEIDPEDRASGRQNLLFALSKLLPNTENYVPTSPPSNPLPVWIVIQCPGNKNPDFGLLNVDVYGYGRSPTVSMSRLARFPVRTIGKIVCGQDGVFRYGNALGERIDVSYCREWMHRCRNHHRNACESPRWSARLRQPDRAFRVIDVVKECIVEKGDYNFDFVALSYVHGGVDDTTLRSNNVDALMRPGGLAEGRIWLPKTIRDALEVTRGLNVRYLWVDILCIVQDDEMDRWEQICQMDMIYGHAAVTIVAATGKTVNSGLRGVSTDRSVKNTSAQLTPGLGFTVPMNKTVSLEPWRSRAWAFQEGLLSKRLLIFSGGHVYFQCRRATLLESMNTADAGYKPSSVFVNRLYLPETPPTSTIPVLSAPDGSLRMRVSPDFAAYARLVTQYTRRRLTSSSDGVAAVTGLLNLLEPDPQSSNMSFGLPKHFMDLALLWQPATGNNVRLQRRPEFPSWSWAGWETRPGCRGGVRYEQPYRVFTYDSGALKQVKAGEDEAEARMLPRIGWSIKMAYGLRKTSGPPTVLSPSSGAAKLSSGAILPPQELPAEPPRLLPELHGSSSRRFSASPAPSSAPQLRNSNGFSTGPSTGQSTLPSTIPSPVPASTSQSPVVPSGRSSPGNSLNRVSLPIAARENGTSDFAPELATPEAPVDFPGASVSLGTGVIDGELLILKTETATLAVLPAPTPRKTTLWLPADQGADSYLPETVHESKILHDGEEKGRVILHDPVKPPEGSFWEFAVLSEAQYLGDEERVDSLGYPLLNVMLIERQAEGKASRAGLGRVYKSAWKAAMPKLEELVLE
ncbi:hypothetical protein CPLU01_08411 [Colletotrichum plurivorum]|uniref:Heterokaryon incompatibility domain-containing protein n=1 Tax=Colletotrichum plurivorum TaxID=2175906 RepID=A0A8H6KBJ7_9PEZI|nr:hypothetical protein CPLU01_08411 [Colletotrichum plurivorum]